MSGTSPSFRELLDWVEGRLDEPRRDAVAEAVERDPGRFAEDLGWIESFHDATRLMPLQTPPPEVSAQLRRVVAERVAPWAPASYDDGVLVFDGREPATASGTRGGGTASGQFVDLVYDTVLGRVQLTLDSDGFSYEMQGQVHGPTPPSNKGDSSVHVVVTTGRQVRASTDCDLSGAFHLSDVPLSMDEVWLGHGGVQIRLGMPPRHPR